MRTFRHRLPRVLLIGLALSLGAGPDFAYYPYYYGRPYYPVPVYRIRDPYPPTGAALGPWRWTVDVGGGPTSVLDGSNSGLNGGGNFTIGTGYNFTPRIGLMLEFSNSWLGLNDDRLLANGADSGDSNVWSVTLDPIWRYRITGPVGGYLIGGGGFYERDDRFWQPVFVPTGGGGGFIAETSMHQHDDTGGLNIGAGFTCNLGWGTKLFVEARYHYIFTSGTPTKIIPVTIGFRW